MRRTIASLFVLSLAVAPPARADELPEMRVNPASGAMEGVEAVASGGDTDIRHVLDPGPEEASEVTWLTATAVDDREPTMEFDGDSDTWVAWWRDDTADTVHVRRLDRSTETWGAVRTVTDAGQTTRRPALGFDGSDVWVAYERDVTGGTAIVAASILDDPEPVGAYHVIATTAESGDRDIALHRVGSEFWVTWVDDDDDVGFSKWDPATSSWSAAGYESYATDTVEDARARIEAALTN